jgi:hypothetical protein
MLVKFHRLVPAALCLPILLTGVFTLRAAAQLKEMVAEARERTKVTTP